MACLITGGETNGVGYSCMIDLSRLYSDFFDAKTNLFGYVGVVIEEDCAGAILWFDENLEYVFGEKLK